MEYEDMLTVDEVARRHAITPIAVYKAVQTGKLKAYRKGGSLRIYVEDADKRWKDGKIKSGRPRKTE